MIRKVKILGLAMVAVLAIGAVGAQIASAVVQFHFEGAAISLRGSQEGTSNAIDFQFGTAKYTTTKYERTTTTITTESTLVLTPTYKKIAHWAG